MDASTTAAADRRWPPEGHTRIPAWIYSDADLFERELQRFFYGPCWNYVGLTCEVPEPGDFRRSWIGRKPVVVVRDRTGAIHVLENRCAHRGTPVCWQESGRADSLICPYHQWRYGLDGTLLSVPFQRGAGGQGGMAASFDKRQHGLRRLRVAVRGGSIWATFDPDAPAFEDYCGPELLGHIDRLLGRRPLRLIGYSRQLLPCNWKLYFENSRDTYHATLLHTFFIKFGLYRADSSRTSTSAPRDGRHLATYSTLAGTPGEATGEITRLQNDLELQDRETVSQRYEFGDISICGLQLFPSAFLQQHANALAIRHIIPQSPTSVELSWTYYGYADDDAEMRRLRLKHANLTGPAGYVSMDDSEVLGMVQGAVGGYRDAVGVIEMGGTGVEPQDTILTELTLRAFYKFYREQMGL